MKMVPYDKEKLGYYRPGKNQRLLLDFANSSYDCVKLEDHTHKSAHSYQANLIYTARRLGLRNIRVVMRKNDIFLLKISE